MKPARIYITIDRLFSAMDPLAWADIFRTMNGVLQVVCIGVTTISIHRVRKGGDFAKARRLLAYYLVAFCVMPLGLLIDVIFWERLLVYQIGYSLSLVWSAASTILLLLLALELFYAGPLGLGPRAGHFRNLFIGVQIGWAVVGAIVKISGNNVTPYIIGVMSGAVILNLVIFFKSEHLLGFVKNEELRRPLKALQQHVVIVVLVLILYVVDSLYVHYTLWSVLGWVLMVLAVWVLDKGFNKPR
jgi:hypothetical protein